MLALLLFERTLKRIQLEKKEPAHQLASGLNKLRSRVGFSYRFARSAQSAFAVGKTTERRRSKFHGLDPTGNDSASQVDVGEKTAAMRLEATQKVS